MFKKHRLLNLILVLASFFSGNDLSAGSIQDQMIQDLEVVKYHLAVKYAPYEWKNEHLGWSLDEAYNKAKMQILDDNPATSRDYHKIVHQFLASTKDYHVNVRFYSTEWSHFPFKIKKVDDRYFFAGFETRLELSYEDLQFFDVPQEIEKIVTENMRGIFIGDEIIEIDGTPIQEVIKKLIDENFYGDYSDTGYELACKNLFLRKAALGQNVPQGNFSITLKSQHDGSSITRTFPWLHMSEMVANHLLKDRNTSIEKYDEQSIESPIRKVERLLTKDYSVGIAKELAPVNCIQTNRPPNLNERDIRQKGFLPELGKVLWDSPKNRNLYAYLYRHPITGKSIGYMYIPTFSKEEKEAEQYLEEIIETIKIFNDKAQGLVLDISDNTGGNFFFMSGLLSVLTNEPLKLPMQREMLIQQDVQNMAVIHRTANLLEGEKDPTLSGYVLTEMVAEKIKKHAFDILQVWESGEVFTPPMYIFGFDEIMPHPKTTFDGPLMVLTNSYCFSCGDLFPAILQDNKRAVIFGQRTAGAGGYVRLFSHPSRFGVKLYSLTGSIAYRLNGLPIENLGVTPDIPYSITERDIRKNYFDYILKLNSEMKNLTK